MFGLDTVRALATKDEITIGEKKYRVKNLISATDNETVLKMRVILEELETIKDVDVELSVVIYQR